MSDESMQKALEFQQKQSEAPRQPPKRTESKRAVTQKPKEGADASEQVQDALADRLGSLAEEQIMDAIQRQVGATRADWADAEDPDTEQASEPSENSEEPDTSPQTKATPFKRFPDGSVLYTAEQLEDD